MDFLFGSDPEAAHPYQGQKFGQQEDTLHNLVMGNVIGQNPSLMGNYDPNSSWGKANPWAAGTKPQGFQQAGQAINGQMTYQQPQINFAQRNPYHFSQPQNLSIPDIYKPQYDMAQKSIMDQGQRTQEQQLAELNSRGMLTSGAANKTVDNLNRDQGNRLADLSSQYSIEQGRMGLQDQQMVRQMDMDRQINQAAELFRQQGASDEQAKFLAQQSLAGFGANLQGRQQATQEEQLANMFRRQPVEDLYRMWAQQTGQIGGTEGSPGLIGGALSAGAGAATQYGLGMI